MKRWLIVVAAIVALALALHALRDDRDVPAPRASSTPAAAPRPAPPTPMPVATPAAGMTQAEADALNAAVDAVQKYLQLAGQGQWDAADGLWRGTPDAVAEGGLRTLLPARVLRIRNEAPEVLDGGAPPRRARVPVRLTLTANDGTTHAFEGSYTVEREADGAAWRLTDADLHAKLGGS